MQHVVHILGKVAGKVKVAGKEKASNFMEIEQYKGEHMSSGRALEATF